MDKDPLRQPITDEAEEAQQRLVRAVEDAANTLPPEQLKDALSRGLENTNTHLHVEDDERESALLDHNGKAKRGPKSEMTREEIIDVGRGLTPRLSRIERKKILLRRALQFEGLANIIKAGEE